MSRLDDYYLNEERQKMELIRKQEEERQLALIPKYNRLVDELEKLIAKIIAKFNRQPPAECIWIEMDSGKKKFIYDGITKINTTPQMRRAAWRIYGYWDNPESEYATTTVVNLLSDGQIVEGIDIQGRVYQHCTPVYPLHQLQKSKKGGGFIPMEYARGIANGLLSLSIRHGVMSAEEVFKWESRLVNELIIEDGFINKRIYQQEPIKP